MILRTLTCATCGSLPLVHHRDDEPVVAMCCYKAEGVPADQAHQFRWPLGAGPLVLVDAVKPDGLFRA